MAGKPAGPGAHMTFDGGIFVPRNTAVAPHVYAYMANVPTPAEPYPSTANCSNISAVRDPVTKLVNVSAVAAVMSKSVLDNIAKGPAAYNRKAIIGGAAGGAIAGAIVGSLMNLDVGKIARMAPSSDTAFNTKLADVARTAVPIFATPPAPISGATPK